MLAFLNTPVGVAYHVVLALSQFLAPLSCGLGTHVSQTGCSAS